MNYISQGENCPAMRSAVSGRGTAAHSHLKWETTRSVSLGHGPGEGLQHGEGSGPGGWKESGWKESGRMLNLNDKCFTNV